MEKFKNLFKKDKKRKKSKLLPKSEIAEDNTLKIFVTDPAEVPDTSNHSEVTTDCPASNTHSDLAVCVSDNEASNSCTEIVCFEDSSDLDLLHCDQLTKDEKSALITQVQGETYEIYPRYYDFCIISSEEDYQSAERFKNDLCNTFDLTGCMLHDGFYRAGRDLFDCFESMMQQSTKILFFLTDNFTANHFYRRLQSGAVYQSIMSRAKQHKEKCVPVFPNGPCYVPLALSGIAGLHPHRPDVLRQSIDSTYTKPIRAQRQLLDQRNCELRRSLYLTLLPRRAQEYVLQKERELEQLSVTYESRNLLLPSINSSISERSIEFLSLPATHNLGGSEPSIQSIISRPSIQESSSRQSLQESTFQVGVQNSTSQSTAGGSKCIENDIAPEGHAEQSAFIPKSVDPTIVDSIASLQIPEQTRRLLLEFISNSVASPPSNIGESIGSLPVADDTRNVLQNLFSTLNTSRSAEHNISVEKSKQVHIGDVVTVNIYSNVTNSGTNSVNGEQTGDSDAGDDEDGGGDDDDCEDDDDGEDDKCTSHKSV